MEPSVLSLLSIYSQQPTRLA